MSRLFGFMCNEPERVKCALHQAREALVAAAAPDGWGLAFFQGGEVLLQRHPKPVTKPLDFYHALRELRSDYVVGHVRDPGAKAKLENTQPYRFRMWVFAHTGTIPEWGAIQAGIVEHIPDFLRRNIRGQAESEYLFHLFLAFLHDAGKLDDQNLGASEASAALRATTAMVDRLVTAAGGQPPVMNVVAANGRVMVAERRGRPMWIWQTNGINDCQVCRAEQNLPHAERRRFPHEHLRSVLIVSEPEKLHPEGWQELVEDSVVSVGRDFTLSFEPLRPERPNGPERQDLL